MSFNDLPQELVELVLDFIFLDRSRSSIPNLKALALVSRRLTMPVQRRIFRSQLLVDSSFISHLCTHLSLYPHLDRYVESVACMFTDDGERKRSYSAYWALQFATLLKACPGLKSLVLFGMWYLRAQKLPQEVVDLQETMQELREIALLSTVPDPVAYATIKSLCRSATRLKELKLVSITFMPGDGDSEDTSGTSSRLPLPPIHHLRVTDCYLPQSTVQRLLQDLSGTVEKLDIDLNKRNKWNVSYTQLLAALGPSLSELNITRLSGGWSSSVSYSCRLVLIGVGITDPGLLDLSACATVTKITLQGPSRYDDNVTIKGTQKVVNDAFVLLTSLGSCHLKHVVLVLHWNHVMQPWIQTDWFRFMEALSLQRQPNLELLQVRLVHNGLVENFESGNISIKDQQIQLGVHLQGLQNHHKFHVQVDVVDMD